MYKKSSLCHLSHTLMAISILLKQLIIVPLKGKDKVNIHNLIS